MIWDILYVIIGIVVGIVIGFLIAKKVFTKQLKENPPINEEMIKTLMKGMGRTPNQKQVNQLMKQMSKFN
mgnify:FL=1